MSGQKLTGHTPGPWEGADNGWIDAADGSSVVEYKGCGSHAACWVNARDKILAIAAPELLQALLDTRERIKNADSWWIDCPDRGGIDLKMIEAAITKATGESQP